MRYQDIDWNMLWQESRKKKTWRSKKSKDWDKRAPSFAQRNMSSTYVDQFLSAIRPKADWTVLDVGSGPGTLAVPLAKQVKTVTAMDFSTVMLDELRRYAEQAGVANIRTIKASWEDNWSELPIRPHDVAIASRSLAVQDLKAALEKLNGYATKRIYISDRVGSGPFDPDIFAAVGRKFQQGPDYIFTLNLLHQMGIHAHVDFLSATLNKVYKTREQAVDSCAWMLDEMTPEEERKLHTYLESHLQQRTDRTWEFKHRRPTKWALIWWDKSEM